MTDNKFTELALRCFLGKPTETERKAFIKEGGSNKRRFREALVMRAELQALVGVKQPQAVEEAMPERIRVRLQTELAAVRAKRASVK